MALDMRLPNASKFYFYEASLIVMRAIVRLAHRYAELAREMAAKETDPVRKQELLDIAEVCEWVPEHPARNLREAIQTHFFCHICAEIEQVGCGYSEAYLGQNLEPFYQRDKAAGLVGPEEAAFMLQNLFVKLNEIGYYYGEKVASAELGRPGSEHLARRLSPRMGKTPPRRWTTMILEASKYLHLPQPPLTCVYTEKMSSKFLDKVLDVIATGVGMPQFANGDVMVQRALNLFADSKKGLTLEKATAHLYRRLRGKLRPLRNRPSGGRAAQPGQDPRAHDERWLRSPHQTAGRTQDRRPRDLQGLRRTVRGLREAD